jgi:hypothetical protein
MVVNDAPGKYWFDKLITTIQYKMGAFSAIFSDSQSRKVK